jgi:hypothetical protein
MFTDRLHLAREAAEVEGLTRVRFGRELMKRPQGWGMVFLSVGLNLEGHHRMRPTKSIKLDTGFIIHSAIGDRNECSMPFT